MYRQKIAVCSQLQTEHVNNLSGQNGEFFNVIPSGTWSWGSVVVKALRYLSDRPGIDSRWCHWWFLLWFPLQNHVTWGWLNIWKWLQGISSGVKTAGVSGWRPTTIVVRNVKIIRGLNLPGTPWANTVCRGRTLLYIVLHILSSKI